MKSVQISLRSYRVLLKLSASLPSTTFSTGVYKVPIFQQQRPRVDHYASLSYIMMTWGMELPTVRIILEDGTLAKKGFLFSFRNYDGDEDNRLYLEAITDEAYLKFLTEGAFGLSLSPAIAQRQAALLTPTSLLLRPVYIGRIFLTVNCKQGHATSKALQVSQQGLLSKAAPNETKKIIKKKTF